MFNQNKFFLLLTNRCAGQDFGRPRISLVDYSPILKPISFKFIWS